MSFTGLIGRAGSGKLLPNEELVLTPQGFVRNDSLRVGDEVISEDGNPTRILKVHEGVGLNIYKVSFSDGTSVEACEDHLWKVDVFGNGDYLVLHTKDMLSDVIEDGVLKYSIPVSSPVRFKGLGELLFPYLSGQYLGSHIRKVINHSLKKGLGIPNRYKLSSIRSRTAILKGLLDSSGYISSSISDYYSINFTNKSEELCEDVANLVRSLGGTATVDLAIDRNTVFISPNIRNLFFKGSTSPGLNERAVKKISAIEPVGVKDGRCIEVESPLHTYVVRDFIVTHNSYTIRKELADNPSFCLKTASTGIAAVNLQDEYGSAITINSALGYFDDKDLLFKVAGGLLNEPLGKIAKLYERIVLDEVSTINSPTISLIHRAITDFNKKTGNDLGLMVVGDFAQLPPVNGKPVFMSQCWGEFVIEYLTEVKRQTDKDFIDALCELRNGRSESVVDYFEREIGFCNEIDEDYEGTTFFSKNKDVDFFNHLQIDKLKTPTKTFPSYRKGKLRSEWKNIPEVLELKEGCLIICLSNNPKGGYANGDLGRVIGISNDYIEVELNRNGSTVSIPYMQVHNEEFGVKLGSIQYLPVRLGWSSTIHKSQGLTLDRVQARLGDNFMSKTHGMGYVLMSRVRSKEGLKLICSREEFKRSFYLDPIYKNYVR